MLRSNAKKRVKVPSPCATRAGKRTSKTTNAGAGKTAAAAGTRGTPRSGVPAPVDWRRTKKVDEASSWLPWPLGCLKYCLQFCKKMATWQANGCYCNEFLGWSLIFADASNSLGILRRIPLHKLMCLGVRTKPLPSDDAGYGETAAGCAFHFTLQILPQVLPQRGHEWMTVKVWDWYTRFISDIKYDWWLKVLQWVREFTSFKVWRCSTGFGRKNWTFTFFDTDIFVIAIDLFAFSMICNVIFTHSSMQRPNIHSPQAPIKNPPSLPKLQGPRTIETNGKGLVWHWHQYKRAPCFGHTSTPNHLSLIAPCSW